MTSAEDERRRRYDDNLRIGRGLAEMLAEGAERIALTLDRLATVHEKLAIAQHHPLREQAMKRAVEERDMAERERRSSLWFRSIASGAYQSQPAGKGDVSLSGSRPNMPAGGPTPTGTGAR